MNPGDFKLLELLTVDDAADLTRFSYEADHGADPAEIREGGIHATNE